MKRVDIKSFILSTVLASALSLVLPLALSASETSDSLKSRGVVEPTLSVGVRALKILPTNRFLRGSNEKGERLNSSVVPVVELTVRNAPGSRYGRWYPSAYQGVGAGVQFSHPGGILGTPALLYALQGARLASLSTHLSLDYEWNFGAAMGWKKLDPEDPGYIRAYDGIGSSVTAYINLGVYLRYKLNSNLSLFGAVEVTHYSNGNTEDPNPGLNMLGARIGVSYTLGATTGTRRADWSDFEPGMVYDVSAYGAWRKWGFYPYLNSDFEDEAHEQALVPGKFAIVGFNINSMYRFNPILSVGLSLDGQYDEGANLSPHYVESTPVDDPRFYRTSFSDRIMLGVSARVEARMSLFAINIGLGHSVLTPGGPDLRGWYNTFSLKTFVTDRVFLLTGYKLMRFKYPGNLMLGLGYRF